jgi:mannan endo-1,4-beta-mannosidase
MIQDPGRACAGGDGGWRGCLKRIALSLAVSLLIVPAASPAAETPFVRREGTHFMAGDQRFYFLGSSCYYLAYWAADTTTNGATGLTYREEADAFLVRCRNLGFNVVRIWAFNEGGDPRALQTAPGVYREEALAGYDYVLNRGSQLGLRFVLTLVNNWSDYGGMRWYATNSSPTAYHSAFFTDHQCRAWYKNHVATLAGRTNTLNGRAYRNDPTIFAWQLANEPRWDGWPKDSNPVDTTGMTIRNWIWEMAAYVKSIDTNHLVSTGEEGWTSAQSWEGTRWNLNGASPDVDYTVIHCWPDSWTWMWGNEPALYSNAMAWVKDHLAIAAQLDKPMVLSEYGKSRPLDGTSGRHAYYQGWFDTIYASAASNGPAAGLHFWMMEAEGSSHDDGFSVFWNESETLSLLSRQADSMNTLIAPAVTNFGFDGSGHPTFGWNTVVGQPAYEVQVSSNLVQWTVEDHVTTNRWTDPASASPQRFYRLRPYWP